MRLSYTIGICVLERFQSHLEEDKYDTETDGYVYDEIDGYYDEILIIMRIIYFKELARTRPKMKKSKIKNPKTENL